MPKQIIIAEQHQIAAVFSEDQIQELVVATGHHQIGDIYLGVVENVLPGIDAAFVNILVRRGAASTTAAFEVNNLRCLFFPRSRPGDVHRSIEQGGELLTRRHVPVKSY